MQNRSYNPNDYEFEDEPSTAQNLVSGAKNLGASAISGAVGLAELPGRAASYLKGEKYADKTAAEKVYSALGGTEPSNMFSKALNYTAGNWPLLLLGGPLTAGKVAADFAGSLGMTAAEEAGFGSLGQLAGGIIGAKGFKSAAKAMSKAPKNPTQYNKFISSYYDKANEAGSKISHNNDKLISRLNDINLDLHKEYVNVGKFDEAARNRVISNLTNAEKNLQNPKLTASDIFKEKQNLNNAYSFKNSTENKYYNRIRKAFAEELDDIGKEHKEFGNYYKTADELYGLRQWQSKLRQWVEKSSESGKYGSLAPNPVAQGALALLGGAVKGKIGGVIGAAAPIVGKNAVRLGDVAARETKFLSKLWQLPDGKKLLTEIMANSAKENFTDLTKNIHKLNRYADEFSKQDRSFNPDDYEFAD